MIYANIITNLIKLWCSCIINFLSILPLIQYVLDIYHCQFFRRKLQFPMENNKSIINDESCFIMTAGRIIKSNGIDSESLNQCSRNDLSEWDDLFNLYNLLMIVK